MGISLCENGAVPKVTGMRWVPDAATGGSLEKCCAKYANGFENSYWMCMNLCSLCCKVLQIDFTCEDTTTDKTVNAADDRNYPTAAVTDSGISFTTSAYGVPLPIVFGADKLPGNVFWASPIRKEVVNDNVFYTVLDFAFGLCEGEINGVLRMWLGDKLIFDSSADVDVNGVMQVNADGFIAGRQVDLTDPDGPLKGVTSVDKLTKIGVFTGSETQLPEGIMATREGYDNVPGYRGVAYVLFENFIVSSNTIPALFVEVTSNTDNNFPRLFGNNETPEVFFDKPNGDVVLVDPSYDLAYFSAEDSNGSATPANGVGIAVFDYNLMEEETQTEIEVTESIVVQYDVARILPLTGFIMLHEESGNAGILHVWNPFTQSIMDTLGPGGSISGHNILTGMSALDKGSLAFTSFDPVTGLPIDVFMGVGTVNQSVGFATVSDAGQITFVSTLDGDLPDDTVRSTFLNLTPSFSDETDTFVDGYATRGQHVMMLVAATDETSSFDVVRVTVHSQTVTLNAPVLTVMDTISADDLIGAGIGHNVQLMLVDPIDKTLIIFITTNSATLSPIVVKYSPYTGEIIWKKPADFFPSGVQGADMAYIVGRKYAWVGSSGQGVYTIDFSTGDVTALTDLVSDEDLPVPLGVNQFYNGAENSITYVSNTANERIVKTYLERVVRSTIELGDIVRLLLQRVGLLATDMNISDLTALTLNGYTINKKQTLRACFSELGQAFKYDVVESNGRIKYRTRGQAAEVTVNHKYLGDVEDNGWLKSKDSNDIARIRKINLKYRDIDREYKDNVQNIILPRYGSQSFDNDGAIDVTVPVVLDATAAKKLAEILLYAKLVYDTTYEITLPSRYANVDPGDVIDITLEDASVLTVRARKVTIGADRVVNIEASKEDPDIYSDVVNLFGNVGRYEDSIFPQILPRIDVLTMDIPFLNADQAAETSSSYFVWTVFLNNKATAAFESDINVTVDGTTSHTIRRPDHFPTWGYVLNPPDFKNDRFATDYTSQLRVKIISTSGAAIASATHADLLASNQVNLCYIGRELLQFTTATDEGDGVWLFTGLHRAKFGTDPFVGQHTIGERFVLLGDSDGLLDTGSIRRIDIDADDPKHVIQYNLRSPNPLQPAPIAFFNALNLRAWAVADYSMTYSGDDAVLSWQRRTRYDGEWEDDGTDQVPVNEIDESYVLFLHTDLDTFSPTNPDTYLRRVELTTNSYTYTLAMQTDDGFDNTVDTLIGTVYQQGGVENFRVGAAKSQFLLPQ